MKICVLCLGYIGLPTACLFANANHEVIGVDINQATLEKLNHNELPFDGKGRVEARTISRRDDVPSIKNRQPCYPRINCSTGNMCQTISSGIRGKFIKLAENEGYKVKVHDPQVKGIQDYWLKRHISVNEEYECCGYEEDAGCQTLERSRI